MPNDKNKLKRYIANAKILKIRYQKANLYGKYDARIAEISNDIRIAQKKLQAI